MSHISNQGYAKEFNSNNLDLIREAYDKSHVCVSAVEVDVYGWLEIIIEIKEDTLATQIRDVGPFALALRDRLLEFQGPWKEGGPTHFLEELSNSQEEKNGPSYKKLAEIVNRFVGQHLQESVKLKKGNDPYRDSEYNLEQARYWLQCLGVNEQEINDYLSSGIQRIELGEYPFDEGKPISRSKMIEKLKTWRVGKEHKAINAQKEKLGET
jgi:hypothetical protein